jgi:hypothetical protein
MAPTNALDSSLAHYSTGAVLAPALVIVLMKVLELVRSADCTAQMSRIRVPRKSTLCQPDDKVVVSVSATLPCA